MKAYHGLKAEKIEFSESSVIATSNCQSIVAYHQAEYGTEQWQQCQEAIAQWGEGGDEGFGEYWYGNRGPDNPDV